jgi:hypothetical protein
LELSAGGLPFPIQRALSLTADEFNLSAETLSPDGNLISGRLSACAAKTQFAPHIAHVHGSSTLREDRNRAGEAENWRAVEEFLNSFKSKE